MESRVAPVGGQLRRSDHTGPLPADTPKHGLGIASGMHVRQDDE